MPFAFLVGCGSGTAPGVASADANLSASDQLAREADRLDALAANYTDDEDRKDAAAAASNAAAQADNAAAATTAGNGP